MNHPYWSRLVVFLIVLAAGGSLLASSGCRGRNRDSRVTQGQNRLGDAIKLATDAERAMKAGRKDQAIALYRQAIEASPDVASAWHNLGVLLMDQKNYMDAAEAFKVAADLSPADPRPYYMMGVAYHEQGWDERALQYFTRALERSPNDVNSLRGAIRVGKRLDLSDRAALDRARRALSVDPDETWRRIEQREVLRIEGVLAQNSSRIELGAPVGAPRIPEPAAMAEPGGP